MIYANKNFVVQEREFTYGKLNCISLGEKGRGRKEVLLPVPKSLEEIKKGINKNLTIGLTKNGKPRVNYISPKKKEEYIYAIIDSYNGYTRPCDGTVKLMYKNGIEELVVAWGADGDAGRIGSWEVKVLKIPNDDKRRFTRLISSGRSEDKDGYIISKGSDIVFVQENDIENYFDMIDEDMPKMLNINFGYLFSNQPFMDIEGREKELYEILKDIKFLPKEGLLKFNRFYENNGKIMHDYKCNDDIEWMFLNTVINEDRYMIVTAEQRDRIRDIIPKSLERFEAINKLVYNEEDSRHFYPSSDSDLENLKNILEYYIENDIL